MHYNDWRVEHPDGAPREYVAEYAAEYVAWARENAVRPDLRWGNLSGADLSGADLRWANLRGADLSGADLRWANLRWGNLRGANLRGADLSGADLSGAFGPFTVFSAGRHAAIFAGGYGHIGCCRYTYREWLDRFAAIGAQSEFTPDEIADYGYLIEFAVRRQRRIEAAEVVEQ